MTENDICPKIVKITANEYNDLYSLRQEIDYFTFNCVKCGKKVIKKYWKKCHIPKYAKCVCQSCIIHENQLNMSKEARKNARIKTLNTIHHKYGQEYSSTSQLDKTKEKAKQTFINKYGVDNPMKLKEIREKSELTFLKNHNGLSQREYFKTCEFQNKIKSIKFDKYGDPNYNNRNKISETKQNYTLKRKEDILTKYYKTINNKSKEEKNREYVNRCIAQRSRSKESYKTAKEKEKNTNLLVYGDENYRNTEKCMKTKLKNHGDPYYTNKIQRLKTMNEKYGINYSGESRKLLNKSRKTYFDKTGYFSALENPNIRKNFKYIILNRYGTYNVTGQYVYNFIRFDSKPELAIWIYCIDHNIPISKASIRFIYNYDNKAHYYEPDFLINDELVEIKGDQFLDKSTGKWVCPYTKLHHDFGKFTEKEKEWWDGLYETKRQCAISNNVKILYEKDYKIYIDYIRDKYGKDYLNKFRIDNKPDMYCSAFIYENSVQMNYFYTKNLSDVNIKGISPFDLNANDEYTIIKKDCSPFDL